MSDFEVKYASWQSKIAEQAKTIRFQVFVDEQSVPEELELDEEDEQALHLVAYQNGSPIGTARLLKDGHIGRMAVVKSHRKSGVGRLLLDHCEGKAREWGLTETFLHAQTYAIPFYEKQGYTVTSDTFMDAGIPHKTMRKQLT